MAICDGSARGRAQGTPNKGRGRRGNRRFPYPEAPEKEGVAGETMGFPAFPAYRCPPSNTNGAGITSGNRSAMFKDGICLMAGTGSDCGATKLVDPIPRK